MIEGFLSNITRMIAMLDDPAGIMGAGDAPAAVTDVVNGAAETVAAAPPPPATGGGDWTFMIIWVGALMIAMYFLMFRGPRKREKKMKEMQASIRTGDNVIVSGGMFGRIADVGEDCFVVEFGTNRGVRIPVLKSDVLGIRDPKLTPPPKVDVVEDKESKK